MAVKSVSVPCLSPASFMMPDKVIPSGWAEHIPFAFWLVDRLRPKIIVELGTHTGASYLAFCQGAQAARLDCRCHAFDTWQGDPHAGYYGESVYDNLRAYHDPRYGSFSTLHRMTFDEGGALFEDGSIDLLHIDGLHTYEAVRHDHEAWLPKLSEHAVVLFHDTNVKKDDFAVFRYWAELAAQHPSFEFTHGNGLGVLAGGTVVQERMRELFGLRGDSPEAEALRQSYHALGQRLTQASALSSLETQNRLLRNKVEVLNVKLNNRAVKMQNVEMAPVSAQSQVQAFTGEEAATSPMPDILVKEFTELQQFIGFVQEFPDFFAPDEIHQAARRIAASGIYCNVYKEAAPPKAVTIHDENYRETIVHKGLNSRVRAIHHVLEDATAAVPAEDLKIFAPEALSAYAKFHRSTNLKFVGSEYTTDLPTKNWLFPIPFEDLHRLSFPDASFHATFVNDVFEHVPYLDRALSELARILKPGGKLVSTFLFCGTSQQSLVRAKLEKGRIVYLTEPEFYSNPFDAKGSLVFEIPGWEILDRTRAAGFRTASMQWVYSESCGILAPYYGGIFVLLAEK